MHFGQKVGRLPRHTRAQRINITLCPVVIAVVVGGKVYSKHATYENVRCAYNSFAKKL